MRRKYAVVLMAMFVLLAGCAAFDNLRPETPEDELALAHRTYAAVLDTAVDLYEAERIDRTTLEAVQEASVHVRRALDEWESALTVGLDPAAAKARYQDSLARMQEALNE